ncbi:ATP-binding cassette domain-containing protein [Corynebacteriaceae bacterium 7-707]
MTSRDAPVLTVTCAFGYRDAVGTVDTVVNPGEIVAVTGANGAGKSTLVDTVAGELEPLDGTVRVHLPAGDLDPAGPEAAGVVLHLAEPSFFPDLTVDEHVALMARLGGRAGDLREEVERWAVAPLLGSLPSRLSSGQRQRAYLGLQLTRRAPVVTLDEPERHLDADWTDYLCGRLREYADAGSAVVVATHAPQIVAASDRVIAL